MGEKLSSTPVVEQEIKLPSPANGPHGIYEIDGNLWTGCKDSCHVVRIKYADPTDYAIYPCSAHPIFIAQHANTGDIYASLDSSSKIWHFDHSRGGVTIEIDIPSTKGTTPVGLIAGPDGNVWFVLVGGAAGGTGTFGRILKGSIFEWFSLPTTLGATAGLLHLAFDWDYQQVVKKKQTLHVWLLSTSMVTDAGNSMDGVFDVVVDTEVGRIVHLQSLAVPTQNCWTHRVLPHRTGLFIAQLKVSSLAHVTGSALFKPTGVASETSDFYRDFGSGLHHDNIKYSGDHVLKGHCSCCSLPSRPASPDRLPHRPHRHPRT